MGKWQIGILVAFFAIYSVTAVATGNATWVIPVAVLTVLALGYATVNWALSRRMASRHGSLEDAMSDNTETIPAAHLIPDDYTAGGDTPEAHDEISPHDLPIDHPGRQAAEAQAGEEREGEVRTTRGDEELAQAAPKREERLEPSGQQRNPEEADLGRARAGRER